MNSLSLLQWIFLTQESNWGFLHCRQILYQLSYQGDHKNKYKVKVNVYLLSRVRLSHQAPLTMGFPRQEYWSGLSFPSPEISTMGTKTLLKSFKT